MEEKYLKSYQYYSDLYDKHTVEKCRWWESRNSTLEDLRKKFKDEEDVDEDELMRAVNLVNNLPIYVIKGERYVEKEEIIKEWMNRDKKHDEFIETVTAPKDIACLTCGRLMFVSSKSFDMGFGEEPDRMLFFYDCPLKHTPRRAFYNNGEELKSKPHLCPKCHRELTETTTREENKIITVSSCSCGYSETDELDLTPKPIEKEKVDPDFEKDRARFCLSKEEGEKYIDGKRRMDQFKEMTDRHDKEIRDHALHRKVSKLKKPKIIELEQLLTPLLEEKKYIRFAFGTPEMTRDVTIPFTVYDADPNREERKSKEDLLDAFNKILGETNWRPIKSSMEYRLGMLSGRLRAYEKEEELVELMRAEWKHNGEQDFEKELEEGFHVAGKGYTCYICGNSASDDETWYDKYGVKCMICKRSIERGEIPEYIAKDKDEKTYYSEYDLRNCFNVERAAMRKWIKEGIIKARVITNDGKGERKKLFLIEDNEGFLPPKKLVKSRLVSEEKDGETHHRMRPWYQLVNPHEHLRGYKIMEYLRVVPPEEMKAREEEEKRKWEGKKTRREAKKRRK